jgi:hypothetical protein
MVHHMRSMLGLAAAIAGLLTYPAAIVAGMTIGDSAAETTVHFVLGTAFVLLATAMFDFGLARWVTWLGAAAAGLFGIIFLLQGVADLTEIPALHWLAFDVLGQQLERVLPDVVYVWFAALLLTGTSGLTRYVGWVIVPVLFGLEVAIVIGAQIGIDVPFILPVIFLPFAWLLLESLKPAAPSRTSRHAQGAELAKGSV